MRYTVYYAPELRLHLTTPKVVDLDGMQRVAQVEADDLEDLFRKMNDVDGTELPVAIGVRSLSVGDVAVDEHGNGYFCAMVGWSPVQVKSDAGSAPTLRSGEL